MREISAVQAWRNVNEANPLARWKSVALRAADPAMLAAGSYRAAGIARDDDIFCAGSCFAKNIEAKLVASGYRVLSHPGFAPADGTPFSALPNIFNIRSIVNEFRWGLTEAQPGPEAAFVADDQGYSYDPHSTVDAFRGPPDVVRRRRAGITANMRRLRDCRVVVLTLGLVEVWFDNETGLYLNATLPRFLLERVPGRYALRVLDYSDCLAGLEEALALLHARGREDAEVFLSVSPVPLAATFTDHDVLVANNYSKATQLAAACDFAARHPKVHYVPSYESVVNSSRRFAWRSDLRHVTDDMVGRITDLFLESQAGGGPASAMAPAGTTDWPVDAHETERHDGVPKFFSSAPGDPGFPAGFPRVTASSVLSTELDASCLMSASKRIWHAQRPPRYPEWLRFDFERPLGVSRLHVQNQDGHPERSPRAMELEALVDGAWRRVLRVKHVRWRYGGEWQGWPVELKVHASAYRLTITANAGDQQLLTIQNVYLAP